MVTRYADDELVWDWTKNPKQDAFVWNRSRFAIWQGGRGSTKTTSADCRIWTTLVDVEGSGEVYPEWYGAQILVAAPIFRQMKRGPLVKFDEVFDDTGLIQRKINGNEPRREFPHGIVFHFFNVGPQGEGAEGWRGSEYAIAHLDEVAQMPEKTFMLANATLRQKRRDRSPYAYQTVLTTTPEGENWMWRRLLNPATRKNYKNEAGSPMYPDDKLFITLSSTKESITAGILEPDYISNLGYVPGTLKWKQEVEGLVVSAAGKVFDQDWKLISDTKLEDTQPKVFQAVYGAIDMGTIDPTCILIVGLDAQGGLWVIKEFYEARARMKDWISIVGEWTKEFSVRRWFVDSDLTVSLMRQAGFQAKTPYKAKDAGDVAVNYINNKIAEGKLHIHPSCLGLLSEMTGYEYKKEFDGDDVTFIQKVKPGQPDHACDAFRYVVLPLSSSSSQQSYGREIGFSIGARA